MKRILARVAVSVVFILLFAGWGATGHKIINGNVTVCFPSSMNFPATWSPFLVAHASDPDNRKSSDPTEAPRHFINIDAYPEFVAHGIISQSYDTNVTLHGSSWVINEGIVPWAIMRWEDSLKRAFQQGNWNLAMQLSADLGHYVGDGHQPLHCTKNYDTDLFGKSGLHSRYETTLVGQYQNLIVYTNDSASYVSDISNFVFNFIYQSNKDVDTVLLADSIAHVFAGSTTGTVYLQKFWDGCGYQIIQLMKNASLSVADLIYTAWVDAGRPNPNASTPVELTSFTANTLMGNVTLSWRTATEINNRGFEIQRKVDDNNWMVLAFKNGNGTTTKADNYSYTDNISGLNANKLSYRLRQVDFNGQSQFSTVVLVNNLTPENYSVSQNFPNPFNPSTIIKYQIPQNLFVSLKVYNSLGQEVATLVNGMINAGSYDVQLNSSNLSSGVYYYIIKAGENFVQTKKMILMK
ncbi:MAG: T9SS type A sorting domain-containing protein [Ignavibacteriaceae bacterium]|nr:T9SS type A sorting domain-containing protein [Ignavibacteriaceae bacterium]